MSKMEEDSKMFYCLNFCLKIFSVGGINPEKGKWQYLHYFIGFFVTSSICSLVFVWLAQIESPTIEDFANCIESASLMTHGIFKGAIMTFNKHRIRNIIRVMRSKFWRLEDVTDAKEKSQYEHNLKFLYLVFFTHFTMCILHTLIFGLRPFFSSSDYSFDVYVPAWLPKYIMEAYQLSIFPLGLFTTIVALDLFILNLIILTQIQFKMLNYELKRLFDGIENGDDNVLKERIKKCVNHHNFLIDFVNEINQTFSTLFVIYLGVIVLSMCVEMFIMSTRESILNSGRSIIYIAAGGTEYIVCYCIPAQSLIDQADEIKHSVYNSDWPKYLSNKSVAVAVQTMIMKGQMLVGIKAKFITLNMEICLNTIRTMVSYCMFLRTVGITG